MLNLLISLMSDTYARVNEGIVVADSKELTEMITDCELLLFWKRKGKSKRYLQVCNEEGSKEGSSWGGTVREIKKQIEVMKENLEINNQTALSKIGELAAKIEELDTKIQTDQKNDESLELYDELIERNVQATNFMIDLNLEIGKYADSMKKLSEKNMKSPK